MLSSAVSLLEKMRRKEGGNQKPIKNKKQKLLNDRNDSLENCRNDCFWDFSKTEMKVFNTKTKSTETAESTKTENYKAEMTKITETESTKTKNTEAEMTKITETESTKTERKGLISYYVMNRELGCIDKPNAKYPKRDIIIERKEYKEIYKEFKDSEQMRMIVKGQPGIGKSAFGLFFILQSIDNLESFNIVYTNEKHIYVIFTSSQIEDNGDNGTVEKSDEFNFKDKKYYVLIHHNENEIPIRFFPSKEELYMIIDPESKEHFSPMLVGNSRFKKIYLASRNKTKHSDYSSTTVTRYLPSWSDNELLQLLSIYQNEKRSIRQIFSKTGMKEDIYLLDTSTPLEDITSEKVQWVNQLFSEGNRGFEEADKRLLSFTKPFVQEWFIETVNRFRTDVSNDDSWAKFKDDFNNREVIVTALNGFKHIIGFRQRICPGILRFIFASASTGGLISKINNAFKEIQEEKTETVGRFRSLEGSQLYALIVNVIESMERIKEATKHTTLDAKILEDYYASIFTVSKYKKDMFKMHYQKVGEDLKTKDAGLFFTNASYQHELGELTNLSPGIYYHLNRTYPVIDGYGQTHSDGGITLFQVTTASKRKNIEVSKLEGILEENGFIRGAVHYYFAVHLKEVFDKFTFPVSLLALAKAQERDQIIRNYLQENGISEDVFYASAADDKTSKKNIVWASFVSYVRGIDQDCYKNETGLRTFYGTRMSNKWVTDWSFNLYKLYAEDPLSKKQET